MLLKAFLILVLHHAKDRKWKITDFGISTEGTSRAAHTTRYARGTSSYRAPEVLRTWGTYTNKVDIWAMGCILYKLIGGESAFRDDFDVQQYSSSPNSLSNPNFSNAYTEQSKCILNLLIRAMLQVDETSRPSAKNIVDAFDVSSENGRVWIYGTAHRNKLLSEYGPSSKNYIDLSPEDNRWQTVQWRRYW